MCGICGIWGVPDAADGDARVAGMLSTIVHRGPDGEGRLARDGVGHGLPGFVVAGGRAPVGVGIVYGVVGAGRPGSGRRSLTWPGSTRMIPHAPWRKRLAMPLWYR